MGGRDWEKAGHRAGDGEKHKGLHIAIAWGGGFTFLDLPKEREKKPQTKTKINPKHHIKLRER